VGKSNSKSKPNVLDVGVKFGKVSIGDETASLPAQMDRERMNLIAADGYFTGKRLVGRIVVGGEDDTAGQGQMDFGDSITGAFDVKKMQVSRKNISINLAFAIASIDVGALAHFAKKGGRLIIDEVGDIPLDEEGAVADPDQRNLKFDGEDVRDCKLERLFSGPILQGLIKGGLDTVGALGDYTAANKDLTDLHGIGPGKAEKIRDTLAEFFKQNS
jgi:hypothetical protein